MYFEDRDITRLPPYKRAPLGLGRTFQIPRPFASASVRENVAVGAMFGVLGPEVNVNESLEIADQIIDFWREGDSGFFALLLPVMSLQIVHYFYSCFHRSFSFPILCSPNPLS